ncbi:hypothetical protein [Amycolatopsis sp. NPDC004079]|uniref:hypothetical protein n=1 Tax=Amycolatopsis sp. NPDC004079 TaxID=3154549 RepID=UPI0033A74ABD
MITAKVKCTQKLENGGEGEDRFVALQFLVDDSSNVNLEWGDETPSLALTMTVQGAVADQFEYKPYTLQLTESE